MPFSLTSHRPARPCSAWTSTPTTRNRQPATYPLSPPAARPWRRRPAGTRPPSPPADQRRAAECRRVVDASASRSAVSSPVGSPSTRHERHLPGVRATSRSRAGARPAPRPCTARPGSPPRPGAPGRGPGRSSPPPPRRRAAIRRRRPTAPSRPGRSVRARPVGDRRGHRAQPRHVRLTPVVEAEVPVGVRAGARPGPGCRRAPTGDHPVDRAEAGRPGRRGSPHVPDRLRGLHHLAVAPEQHEPVEGAGEPAVVGDRDHRPLERGQPRLQRLRARPGRGCRWARRAAAGSPRTAPAAAPGTGPAGRRRACRSAGRPARPARSG